MERAKPAVRDDDGGHRKITVSDWKPHEKNTLRGFFAATMPSGIVFHGLMLHQKGEARWISFPAREYIDGTGAKQFSRIVEFRDNAAANKFRDAVLDALDVHLERLQ